MSPAPRPVSRLRAWLILGGALLALAVGAVLRFGPNVMKLFESPSPLLTGERRPSSVAAPDSGADY